MTNQTGSQYSSPFLSAASVYSPTNLRQQYPADPQTLKELYAKINATAAPSTENRTVFTDISTELASLSNDEKEFVFSSDEYIAANGKYQMEFSNFLIDKFSNEFLAIHQKTMEELLGAIKASREKYRNKFAADIASIKKVNTDLEQRNKELLESNAILQRQLETIQQKIGAII